MNVIYLYVYMYAPTYMVLLSCFCQGLKLWHGSYAHSLCHSFCPSLLPRLQMWGCGQRGQSRHQIPFVFLFSRTAEIEHRAFHMLHKRSAAEPQPLVWIFLFEPHILAWQFLPQPLEGSMRTRRGGEGEKSRDQGQGEAAAEGVTLKQRVLPSSDSLQCLKLCLPLVTILASLVSHGPALFLWEAEASIGRSLSPLSIWGP